MENNSITFFWDILIEYNIATDEELQLISQINGYNMESLEDILYVRTGLNDFEQLLEDDPIETNNI